jgi:hypothetical protein
MFAKNDRSLHIVLALYIAWFEPARPIEPACTKPAWQPPTD